MKYLLAFMLVCFPAAAHSASSDWLETSGAKLRLIARDTGAGKVEAAFQISLENGWKTYWKVPGSSGVPPHIVFATDPFGTPLPAGADATIHYPVPTAFSDGAGWAAGYTSDVTFPIDIVNAGTLTTLYGSGLVGICADICIPVQFNLSVDLNGSAQSNADEARIFAEARARLPTADHAVIDVANVDEATGTVGVTVPRTAKTAFWFDLAKGAPVEADHVENGRATFSLPPHAISAEKALIVVDDEGCNRLPSLIVALTPAMRIHMVRQHLKQLDDDR